MRLRQHSSAILLWLGALLFAVLAGVAIPLLSGQSPGPSATDWTPPPTAITATVLAQLTATPAPSAITRATAAWSTPTLAATARDGATATAAPTATPSTAPTASPAKPTAAPTISAAARSSARALARIARGPANLRTGPGTTFTVLATAKNGDEFDIMGRSEDGLWVQLCCVAGAPVWASADLTELPGPIAALPVVP